MKAFLMYPDKDFDFQRKPLWNEADLIQDLEVETLLKAMALGDKFLYESIRITILFTENDVKAIIYRQNVVKDCVRNPSVVRDLYKLIIDAFESDKRRYYSIFSRYPGSMLHSAVEVMYLLMGTLKKMREIAERHEHTFDSAAFKTLFAMIRREFSDDYLNSVYRHLSELKFKCGVLLSARLGHGNKGLDYVLRAPNKPTKGFFGRLFEKKPREYSITIADRDESGARAHGELRDRGINAAAAALSQAVDHVLSFLTLMRHELAFYLGCLNLYDALARMDAPVCFPVPEQTGAGIHLCTGLYDVSLALNMNQIIVGNDLDAQSRDLVVITGANHGGKTTFLRSVGLSQLMLQCGMFVPARSMRAGVYSRIFTHFKRQEDKEMKSGKLDEELARMKSIVDGLRAGSLLLCNESFSATNEREGSEIARQII